MKLIYRKGVFLVVFSGDKYLLLHRKLHWKGWEFPKGGIEPGESMNHAVKRELREETGLKARKIINMKTKGKFNYDRILEDRKGIKGQTWKLFAVEVYPGKIKIDKLEHDKYSWENFSSAIKKLTWPNQKKCLKIVNSKFS